MININHFSVRLSVKREAFVWMCLGYQIRRGDPPRLQWITVVVIGKHDDPADCRTAHDQIQSHLVDKHRPEFHRNIGRVRTKTLARYLLRSCKRWIGTVRPQCQRVIASSQLLFSDTSVIL